MKRIIVIIIVSVFALQYCSTTKKNAVAMPKHLALTYVTNVKPAVEAYCAPCHFPPKGNKEPLDSYTAVKNNIDDMIRRVSMNPGEHGFMPARHPKLSDSTIAIFTAWKTDGLLEK